MSLKLKSYPNNCLNSVVDECLQICLTEDSLITNYGTRPSYCIEFLAQINPLNYNGLRYITFFPNTDDSKVLYFTTEYKTAPANSAQVGDINGLFPLTIQIDNIVDKLKTLTYLQNYIITRNGDSICITYNEFKPELSPLNIEIPRQATVLVNNYPITFTEGISIETLSNYTVKFLIYCVDCDGNETLLETTDHILPFIDLDTLNNEICVRIEGYIKDIFTTEFIENSGLFVNQNHIKNIRVKWYSEYDESEDQPSFSNIIQGSIDIPVINGTSLSNYTEGLSPYCPCSQDSEDVQFLTNRPNSFKGCLDTVFPISFFVCGTEDSPVSGTICAEIQSNSFENVTIDLATFDYSCPTSLTYNFRYCDIENIITDCNEYISASIDSITETDGVINLDLSLNVCDAAGGTCTLSQESESTGVTSVINTIASDATIVSLGKTASTFSLLGGWGKIFTLDCGDNNLVFKITVSDDYVVGENDPADYTSIEIIDDSHSCCDPVYEMDGIDPCEIDNIDFFVKYDSDGNPLDFTIECQNNDDDLGGSLILTSNGNNYGADSYVWEYELNNDGNVVTLPAVNQVTIPFSEGDYGFLSIHHEAVFGECTLEKTVTDIYYGNCEAVADFDIEIDGEYADNYCESFAECNIEYTGTPLATNTQYNHNFNVTSTVNYLLGIGVLLEDIYIEHSYNGEVSTLATNLAIYNVIHGVASSSTCMTYSILIQFLFQGHIIRKTFTGEFCNSSELIETTIPLNCKDYCYGLETALITTLDLQQGDITGLEYWTWYTNKPSIPKGDILTDLFGFTGSSVAFNYDSSIFAYKYLFIMQRIKTSCTNPDWVYKIKRLEFDCIDNDPCDYNIEYDITNRIPNCGDEGALMTVTVNYSRGQYTIVIYDSNNTEVSTSSNQPLSEFLPFGDYTVKITDQTCEVEEIYTISETLPLNCELIEDFAVSYKNFTSIISETGIDDSSDPAYGIMPYYVYGENIFSLPNPIPSNEIYLNFPYYQGVLSDDDNDGNYEVNLNNLGNPTFAAVINFTKSNYDCYRLEIVRSNGDIVLDHTIEILDPSEYTIFGIECGVYYFKLYGVCDKGNSCEQEILIKSLLKGFDCHPLGPRCDVCPEIELKNVESTGDAFLSWKKIQSSQGYSIKIKRIHSSTWDIVPEGTIIEDNTCFVTNNNPLVEGELLLCKEYYAEIDTVCSDTKLEGNGCGITFTLENPCDPCACSCDNYPEMYVICEDDCFYAIPGVEEYYETEVIYDNWYVCIGGDPSDSECWEQYTPGEVICPSTSDPSCNYLPINSSIIVWNYSNDGNILILSEDLGIYTLNLNIGNDLNVSQISTIENIYQNCENGNYFSIELNGNTYSFNKDKIISFEISSDNLEIVYDSTVQLGTYPCSDDVFEEDSNIIDNLNSLLGSVTLLSIGMVKCYAIDCTSCAEVIIDSYTLNASDIVLNILGTYNYIDGFSTGILEYSNNGTTYIELSNNNEATITIPIGQNFYIRYTMETSCGESQIIKKFNWNGSNFVYNITSETVSQECCFGGGVYFKRYLVYEDIECKQDPCPDVDKICEDSILIYGATPQPYHEKDFGCNCYQIVEYDENGNFVEIIEEFCCDTYSSEDDIEITICPSDDNWSCVEETGCVQVPYGTGDYNSEQECIDDTGNSCDDPDIGTNWTCEPCIGCSESVGGEYLTQAGCESVCFEECNKWKCNDQNLLCEQVTALDCVIEPCYNTEQECYANQSVNCPDPSPDVQWVCDDVNGGCYSVPQGQGVYETESACLLNCTFDCNLDSGECEFVGNNGNFGSMLECQTAEDCGGYDSNLCECDPVLGCIPSTGSSNSVPCDICEENCTPCTGVGGYFNPIPNQPVQPNGCGLYPQPCTNNFDCDGPIGNEFYFKHRYRRLYEAIINNQCNVTGTWTIVPENEYIIPNGKYGSIYNPASNNYTAVDLQSNIQTDNSMSYVDVQNEIQLGFDKWAEVISYVFGINFTFIQVPYPSSIVGNDNDNDPDFYISMTPHPNDTGVLGFGQPITKLVNGIPYPDIINGKPVSKGGIFALNSIFTGTYELDSGTSPNQFSLQYFVVHELGHALGLRHEGLGNPQTDGELPLSGGGSDTPSIMDNQVDPTNSLLSNYSNSLINDSYCVECINKRYNCND